MAFGLIEQGVIDLHSVDFHTQLGLVKKALDQSQPRITFLGLRVVQVQDAPNSIPLDSIANRVLLVGEERNQDETFTLEERDAGKAIVKKLAEFYRMTDERIRTANFVTRFSNLFREFCFLPKTTRLLIENTNNDFAK